MTQIKIYLKIWQHEHFTRNKSMSFIREDWTTHFSNIKTINNTNDIRKYGNCWWNLYIDELVVKSTRHDVDLLTHHIVLCTCIPRGWQTRWVRRGLQRICHISSKYWQILSKPTNKHLCDTSTDMCSDTCTNIWLQMQLVYDIM